MDVPVGGELWSPRYFGEPPEPGCGSVEVSNLEPPKDTFFGSHLNPCMGSSSPPGEDLWEEYTSVHCGRKTPARAQSMPMSICTFSTTTLSTGRALNCPSLSALSFCGALPCKPYRAEQVGFVKAGWHPSRLTVLI